MNAAATAPPFRLHLQRACQTSLEEHQAAWLLSVLTDRSYEEGDRSRDFRESCMTMASAGLGTDLVRDIQGGINARLADRVRAAGQDFLVRRNQSHGPDLEIHAPSSKEDAVIEVKQVYDLTTPRYYSNVAEDGGKLQARKSVSASLQTYQVIYFTQLPCFDYPSGSWYSGKACKARTGYPGLRGIGAQHEKIQSLLGPQTWPHSGSPCVMSLEHLSTSDVGKFASAWMRTIFHPSTSWSFDPTRHLKGAAVGVSIWAT